MEMSEILGRAKELVAQYEANGYIHRDATLLLPELIAECEFWRREAIEATARANFYQECNDGNCWWNPDGKSTSQKEYREQAERELEAMR